MTIITETEEFITQELLQALFSYNSETGVFTRRITTGSKAKAGSVAGYLTEGGYIEFSVLSNKYKAHRLAWIYCFGEFPENILDHIDGNRSNNRLDNLREATIQQNSFNSTNNRSDNTTGFRGVSLDKRCNRYRAYITTNNKQKSLGYYDTAEEAGLAYQKAAKELHGEFYNANPN